MQHNRSLLRFFCVAIIIAFILTISIFKQTLNVVDQQASSLSDVYCAQIRSDMDSALGIVPELASLLGSNLLVYQFSQRGKLNTSAGHYELYEMLQSLAPYSNILENNSLLLDFAIYYPNSDTLVNRRSYYQTEAWYSQFYLKSDISYDIWLQMVSSNISGRFISEISTESILVYVQSIDIEEIPAANIMILVDWQKLQSLVNNLSQSGYDLALSIDGIMICSDENLVIQDALSAVDEETDFDTEYGISRLSSGSFRDVYYYVSSATGNSERGDYRRVFLYAVGIAALAMAFVFLYWYVLTVQRTKLQKSGAENANFAIVLKTAVNDLFSSKQDEFDDSEWWIVKDALLDLLTYGTGTQDDVLNTLSDHNIVFHYSYYLVILYQLSEPALSSVFTTVSARVNSFTQDQIMCAGFPIGQRKFAVLLNFEDSMVEYQSIVEQIRTILHQEGNSSITVFIGSIQKGADNIFYSYKDANALADYVIFTGTNAILDHNVFLDCSAEYYYPMNVELNLIKAVSNGNETQVLNILKEIHDKNFIERQLRPDMAKLMLNELAGTTLKITQNIECDLVENSAARVLQCSTVDEVFYTLQEIYVNACRRQSVLAEDSRREQFKQYILLHYTDADFSQSKMAEDLNMTQNYLSSQFKAYFGVTMISYINSLRADHAAMLLKETDSTVQDIAVLCGFNNSDALARVFKQKYGITPSNYRSSINKKEGH